MSAGLTAKMSRDSIKSLRYRNSCIFIFLLFKKFNKFNFFFIITNPKKKPNILFFVKNTKFFTISKKNFKIIPSSRFFSKSSKKNRSKNLLFNLEIMNFENFILVIKFTKNEIKICLSIGNEPY